jgi:hypothetical protein
MERVSQLAEKDYERGVLPRWKCVNCPGEFCMSCAGLGSYMSETPLKAGDVLFSETTIETVSKTTHRQVTVDGQRFDMRNARNFNILHARVKDLLTIMQGWMTDVNEPLQDLKQRRVSRILLERAILLRGLEIEQSNPTLYDLAAKATRQAIVAPPKPNSKWVTERARRKRKPT